jgi:hypothetical protein
MGSREFRSLVHGDLTPRNIRITSSQKVKVLDFGIAKALSLSRKVTRNDFGTLWYLSPERLESGVVDEYADFWAIGVILYEMVRAARPFQAEDTRRLERMILSRNGAPSLNGLCPGGLESVIAKLLAADPADRYSRAQAIREDLQRFRSGQQTQAEKEGWPRQPAQEPETRRSQPPVVGDDEKTRRTSKPVKDAAPPVPRWISAKVRRAVVAVLIVMGLVVVGNDVSVGSSAAKVTESVPKLELEQLDEVWGRYEELSRRAFLPIGTMGLANALIERSNVLAERVIANYRTSLPTIREAQWRSARDALARAVAEEPDDKQLRAALRYCEGHLHRINGEAKRARRETAGAEKDMTAAVAAFREAAELRPRWPDPFLGLARTFIYGLQDVDRGADALRQAEIYGYKRGERETSQLADGYRVRGDALARNARELNGLPQERDYLERSADAYREALTHYLVIEDYSKLGANIRAAQRGLDRVEKRLADLSAASTETGWSTPLLDAPR